MSQVVFTRLPNGDWVEGYAEGMSVAIGFNSSSGPTLDQISHTHHVPYDLLHKAFVGGTEEAAPVAQAENARDLPEPSEEAPAAEEPVEEEAPKPKKRKKKGS